jgi:hypothetical protein
MEEKERKKREADKHNFSIPPFFLHSVVCMLDSQWKVSG